MPIALIVILSTLVFSLFFIALPIFLYQKSYVKLPKETQWKISDKEILMLINQQANGYLTPKDLEAQSSLTLSESKSRLNNLLYKKAITSKYTGMGKRYLKLIEPIDERPAPLLSSNPYITTSDLLILFERHNYELSLQKICIDTGLPVNVIIKELNCFAKEKIIIKLYDQYANTTYILSDAYKDKPESLKSKSSVLDLDLSKIYMKEVKGKR